MIDRRQVSAAAVADGMRTIFLSVSLALSATVVASCIDSKQATPPNYSPEHPAYTACRAPRERAPLDPKYPFAKYVGRLQPVDGVLASPSTQALLEEIAKPLRQFYAAPDSFPRIHVTSNPAFGQANTVGNGDIYVSIGTLAQGESLDEVAGIIAHEMAHVSCGHRDDAILAGALQWMMRAGSIGGAFVGLPTAAAGGTIIGGHAVHNAFGSFIDSGWSRNQEQQADLVAVDALVEAGYYPGGIANAIARFPDDDGDEREGPFSAFFGPDHPRPSVRVERINDYRAVVYPGHHAAASSDSPLNVWKKKTAALTAALDVLYEARWTLVYPFALLGRTDGLCSSDRGRRADQALKKSPQAIFSAAQGYQSADPEAAGYFQMSLTRWVWAETYLRNGGDVQAAKAQFAAALEAQDAPLDLYFVSALAQMKNGNVDAAKALMMEARKRFGDNSILYPLELATLGPNPKSVEGARATFIKYECLLTADIGKLNKCTLAQSNPQAYVDREWSGIIEAACARD